MPDVEVTTIKDLIYYEYAKIMTRNARNIETNFMNVPMVPFTYCREFNNLMGLSPFSVKHPRFEKLKN